MTHHNTGKKNAKKDNPANKWIQIRCTQEDKDFIKSQLREGETLSSFIMDLVLFSANCRSNDNWSDM